MNQPVDKMTAICITTYSLGSPFLIPKIKVILECTWTAQTKERGSDTASELTDQVHK